MCIRDSANFGLLWNMNEQLTLGAVVKTPFDADIRHEYRFTQTSVYGPPLSLTDPGTPQAIDEDVELRMPLSYGVGLAWRVSDALSFDLAYQLRWGRDVDTGNLIATSEADIMQHLFLASVIIHF